MWKVENCGICGIKIVIRERKDLPKHGECRNDEDGAMYTRWLRKGGWGAGGIHMYIQHAHGVPVTGGPDGNVGLVRWPKLEECECRSDDSRTFRVVAVLSEDFA